MDSWRTWEHVLPALERRHEVFAPALPGHAGGPRLGDRDAVDLVADLLDAAGLRDPVEIAGNSLGGWIALKLAERGRARAVVAIAPAGGWPADAGPPPELFEYQRALKHSPYTAPVPEADAMLDRAALSDWSVDASRIACPVRFIWGTADELLPWPAAAASYREAFPHADWVELDGVGHYPQLEVPAVTAELISRTP
jgi:pimeloyl-ACP methyl ester carboxylesterase